jgi:hypothetical protein
MTRENDIVTLKCEAERFPVPLKEFALKRRESPLRHEITVNSYAIRRDEMYSFMTENGIPKDPTLTLVTVQNLIRAKGKTVAAGFISSAFYKGYCALPQAWTPTAFDPTKGDK